MDITSDTGTLVDVFNMVLLWLAQIAVVLMPLASLAGIYMAGMGGIRLWNHVQNGEHQQVSGSFIGSLIMILSGCMMTTLFVYIGYVSLTFIDEY